MSNSNYPILIISNIENSTGGLDLLIEKDEGNKIQILTGNKKNSLKFWKELSELCEGAIFSLNDK